MRFYFLCVCLRIKVYFYYPLRTYTIKYRNLKVTKMKRKLGIKLIYILGDIILAFTFGLFTFRFSGIITTFNELNQVQINSILIYSAALALTHVVLFLIFKIYNILSTNFSIIDAVKVASFSFIASLIGLVINIIVPDKYLIFAWPELISWAVSTVMLMALLTGMRISPRLLRMFLRHRSTPKTVRTLVIGAGGAGKIVVDDARYNVDNKHNVVVIMDDDPKKIGGMFLNIPVKGPINEIEKVIKEFDIEEVDVAVANIDKNRLHEILKLLSSSNVRVRRFPLLSEMEGPNDKQLIDVDIEDLLGREPVILDNSEINTMLHEKCVLVTGAGGSIGSELVRQIFNTHPKTLILFDIYENSTYDIQQELVRKMRNENIKDINLVTLIGSTYNETRVEQIFKKYRPDYVYHAAAYKHVPLMEDSPAEAIRTNVIGTYNVAKTADKYQAKKMVLVSTDKAVRPTNVMGATKRFAEMIIQHFAEVSKNTKYAAVRFGNVLGSNGSVVPLFKKQIEEGGPVTITDKNIIRYFMTIPEAVSLILQCGLFADGGEIFILDMGKPVKILDLAEKLIRQAGKTPGKDIKIVETGLRPGEKLYEELLLDAKSQQKTKNNRIFIETREKVACDVLKDLNTVQAVFKMSDVTDVKDLLSKIITTYRVTNNK